MKLAPLSPLRAVLFTSSTFLAEPKFARGVKFAPSEGPYAPEGNYLRPGALVKITPMRNHEDPRQLPLELDDSLGRIVSCQAHGQRECTVEHRPFRTNRVGTTGAAGAFRVGEELVYTRTGEVVRVTGFWQDGYTCQNRYTGYQIHAYGRELTRLSCAAAVAPPVQEERWVSRSEFQAWELQPTDRAEPRVGERVAVWRDRGDGLKLTQPNYHCTITTDGSVYLLLFGAQELVYECFDQERMLTEWGVPRHTMALRRTPQLGDMVRIKPERRGRDDPTTFGQVIKVGRDYKVNFGHPERLFDAARMGPEAALNDMDLNFSVDDLELVPFGWGDNARKAALAPHPRF